MTVGQGKNGVAYVRPASADAVARPAVTRRVGRSADLATLRARVEMARMLGDAGEERTAAGNLAARLAAREQELDLAVELVRRTLATEDDPALRQRLAGWLERLGEPALAAAELRRLPDEDDPVRKASRLVRIGVLHARGGDASGAIEALSEAASADPTDPLPLELLATLPAWASPSFAARDGADAYARAARRRAAEGDVDRELEDLLRAVELDPASPIAIAALATRFAKSARSAVADLVLRRHAEARLAAGEDHEAQAVHERRLEAALEEGDLGRALFAAFDGGLDAIEGGPEAEEIDALLARASAFELLAARLAVRAERATAPRIASARWAELGRLAAGPLAATDRALEAYARAVVADPENAEALHALRGLSRRGGNTAWLVEGLVRASRPRGLASGDEGPLRSRAFAARVLAEVAEDLREPLLAGWAHGVVASSDPGDLGAGAAAARSETALRRRDEEVALARRALEACSESAKGGLLGELVRLLRTAPDASKELADVLTTLSAIHREDDLVLWEAVRIAERCGDVDAVVSLCRTRLARPPEPPRLRVALVSALRRAGRIEEAAAAARGLAAAVTPWAYSEAWVTAQLAGDACAAAEALAALAPTCTAPASVVLGVVAGEALVRAGKTSAARRALELAARADPGDPRAASALASVVSSAEGRVAAAALEHAIETAYPTASSCLRLADVLEAVGDGAASLAWAKRAVALRPGFATAMEALVARALRGGDLDAAVESLEWLLPQPEPSRVTAERVAPILRALGERDPIRACAVAKRAIDVLGPRAPGLRAAASEVALAAGAHELRATILERWIASGAPAAERQLGLFELGAICAAQGDLERELSAYLRVAREGGDLTRVRDRIVSVEPAALTPDAELAWLEVSAELARAEGRTDDAIRGFRELGAAFWDLADDRARAVQAWFRAAQLDAGRGYVTLRRDLVQVADAAYAVEVLSELAEREPEKPRAARVASEAARAALEAGEPSRALVLAKLALEKDAGHGEALELAEVASTALGRAHEMSPLYDHVARRALGRFGRRAAHHRAARFFAESGVQMLALKHAAQAFIAVPSEGSTLELLRRTADQADRRSIAVRTVEHVAELAKNNAVRAGWLLRAAQLAARDLEGTRQRVDLLLRAAVLLPSPGTLATLGTSTRELLGLAPEDAEGLVLRLARASESVAKSLEGPDGARIALAFARIAVELFADATWALTAIERATVTDADVDEYAALVQLAPALARAKEARASLDALIATTEQPYANVGVALFRLVGALAAALGDPARAARALVRAVEKDEDDDLAVAEADLALSRFEDPELEARLSRRAPAERRIAALRTFAKRARDRGEDDVAVVALGRARALAPEDEKNAVDEELCAALGAAGRVEEAVELALSSTAVPAVVRAARWEELGQAKEASGDHDGAAVAWTEAARLESTPVRWTASARLAEHAERPDLLLEALRCLVDLTPPGERRDAQKRLARVEGARGELERAEASWRAVWSDDPSDGEPDVAIEALLVARADYEALSEHLAARVMRLAARGAAPEALRAVRLRRAAILEQRLGKLAEACAELERVLAESPGHASGLRWLADLYERSGEPARALPALEQLAHGAAPASERKDAAVRLVRALIAVGETERARQVARALSEENPGSVSVLEVRVEVARALARPGELGEALASLARVSAEDAKTRSEMLVEAAQAAARAGDTAASLERARDAALLAPEVASTQLFARGLEYRLRGAGDAELAQATVAALAPLVEGFARAGLAPEDVALGTFLLAEAKDVVASGSGEAVLRAALGEVGPQPLVALGLAERAAAKGSWNDALRFYVQAVEGNLLGLRRAGRVALVAADVAERAERPDLAHELLDEAALDPETRVDAIRRKAALARAAGELGKVRELLGAIVPALEGDVRADVLADLARALFLSRNPADRLEADRTMREAIDHAPPEVALKLRAELGGHRTRPPSSMPVPDVPPPPSDLGSGVAPPVAGMPAPGSFLVSAPPRLPAPRASVPPPLPAPRASSAPPRRGSAPPMPPMPSTSSLADVAPPSWRFAAPLDVTPAPVAVAVASASSASRAGTPAPAARGESPELAAKLASARERLARGEREAGEKLLTEALREGSLAAADTLDELLRTDAGRSATLLKVRRHAVELAPGDLARLEGLRAAARADQNHAYARAIEHVQRAFDLDARGEAGAAGASSASSVRGPLAPPPLGAQRAQPGMLGMLARHSAEPAGEAFGCVWEGARPLFARPLTAYGTSGLARVQAGPTSTLSRLYEVALRLLDTPPFVLFHEKTKAAFSSEVALLENPAVVLHGEPRDENDLKWGFGKALASVLPENALPLGMPAEEGRLLWRVIVSAFGPPRLALPFDRASAAIADRLWQTLSPRAQRRIGELLERGAETPFEVVAERARQSGLRVGLFLTGDFGFAARAVLAEQPTLDASELGREGGLARLCAALPPLADLFRLAVRPEYADARWQVPPPTPPRFVVGGVGPVL